MNLLEREGYFGYGPRCNQFYSEHLNAIETRYNTLQTHVSQWNTDYNIPLEAVTVDR